ncbi:MAG: response regulator [Ignavibacteriales bacterium]|nr:response regulator [Ignavibacteriales bacterium]
MEQRATLLLVDDDTALLSVLAKTIEETGLYEVLTASDGAEALAIAEEHLPAVIVSDYYMPVMDGFELCEAIKKHPVLHDTMFMLLTSASEIEIKVKGFSSGTDDYLTKPFLAEELISRIQALMRLKNLHDELKEDKFQLARLNEQLEESFIGVVSVLTDLMELKVPNASMRGKRAAEIAQWIGKRLECNEKEIKQLEITARLHEIGKIRLSDGSLRKKEQELTAAEHDALSRFPVYGELIIKTVPNFKEEAKIIRHQMENYDGTGSPDKLMKDEIPVFSRIIRAINILEQSIARGVTMNSELIEELHKARGTQLDPRIAQLVEEYVRVVDNPSWLENKRQITIYELMDGMVIATDLCTGNGVKLLSKDTKISSSIVDRIIAHHQVDPIVNLIYVYL